MIVMLGGAAELENFAAAAMQNSTNRDLVVKVKKTCNGMNETIHMIANDPSLGMYRVQQHVKKSLPKVIDAKKSVKEASVQLQGLVYDASYAGEAIKSITISVDIVSNIEALLRESTSNAAVIKMKSSTQLL